MTRRVSGTLALVVLALLVAGTAAIHAGDTGDLLHRARRAFHEGDYGAAEELWTAIEEMGGYEWEANFFLGMTYLRQDVLGEAADHMGVAHALRPRDYGTLVNYARILYRDGQLEKAREILGQVPEELRERDEQYHNVLGLISMAERDLEGAVELFLAAVDVNPENHYVLNNLGLALIRAGDYQRASEYLERAAAQEPPEAYVYNNLGIAYENLNKLEQARESYEEALNRDPDHELAATNLKRVLARIGE